ncbi:hypothetical protein B0H14DRAFT_3427083 [Mycena olivaceomarginata]|nr:hypothetical protein B0H14DRAFT_3444134 [Mycena olivaceomarginata]KAJ7894306.1 hypothetical protein B0H14DRAFT_3427083 [Mycena olivaceomarginata]
MRFTTATSLASAATLLVLNVRADLIAWTGPLCNLDEGADVVCNGECIAFSSRNSFQVTSADGNTVNLFTGLFCNAGTEILSGFILPGECIKVNPATPGGSFSCI